MSEIASGSPNAMSHLPCLGCPDPELPCVRDRSTFGEISSVWWGEDENKVPAAKKSPTTQRSASSYLAKEADVLQAIQPHPNIIGFYGYKDDCIYMELSTEGNLAMFAAAGRFSEVNGRVIFKGVCKGVQHMHSLGFIHRDIKPGNVVVFIDSDGSICGKLIDFGLSERFPLYSGALLNSNGTPGFKAPELDVSIDFRSDGRACDVYSLGASLFLCMARRCPKGGEQLDMDPKWSWAVFDLIQRMTMYVPMDRPSLQEVLESAWLNFKADSPRPSDLPRDNCFTQWLPNLCVEKKSAYIDSVYWGEKSRLAARKRPKLKRAPVVIMKHEVFMLTTIKPHPNIIEILEMKEHCIWMELSTEGDLAKYVFAGHFNELSGRPLFKGICLAVQHLHSNNIIHRDIRPENVVLFRNPDGSFTPKLIDFAVAEVVEKGKALPSAGIKGFKAPEIPKAKKAVLDGKACDVYSMGATLYMCMSKLVPKSKCLGKGGVYSNNWSMALTNLISKVTSLHPGDRGTIGDILESRWLNPEVLPDGSFDFENTPGQQLPQATRKTVAVKVPVASVIDLKARQPSRSKVAKPNLIAPVLIMFPGNTMMGKGVDRPASAWKSDGLASTRKNIALKPTVKPALQGPLRDQVRSRPASDSRNGSRFKITGSKMGAVAELLRVHP